MQRQYASLKYGMLFDHVSYFFQRQQTAGSGGVLSKTDPEKRGPTVQ